MTAIEPEPTEFEEELEVESEPVAVDSKAARRARRRAMVRPAGVAEAVVEAVPLLAEPRTRKVLFSASAAAAGHLVLWSVTGDPLYGVGLMASATVSVPQMTATAITVGAAVAGWKAVTLVHLHRLPGFLGILARPAGAIAAAMWGQGTAPVVRDVLASAEPWGSLLSPLLAVAPTTAACWFLLERRAAQSSTLVRWLARVPLATVIASALLYAPGVVL
ncbi:hypothetical protein [Streptomyces kronopolitis]|uniref:hypothetical protein n=1 Tax=Streptomyces kronopolitis TaxID=1612435 RepID=UPI00369E0C69